MPKLPRGMFKRGSSFYVRLRGGYKDRWICLGKEYDEACRQLRELKTGAPPASSETVGELAQKWAETYCRTTRNAKGRSLAARRVERFLEPFLGHLKLARLAAEDLRRYRLWLEKRGLAPQSVAHVLSDARCFLNWCADSGLAARSPFPRRLMPRLQERPPDRLNDSEVVRLLSIREPYRFVIALGLGTGLRWSELCRAQAAHLERGLLVVSHTKSGRVRRVPVGQELQQAIAGRVGRLVSFSQSNGGGFSRKVRELSGVGGFHAHQLRHTFACRWLENGGSLAALQEILGHASILTTQRYARLSELHVRAEAERVEGRMRGQTVAGR
jgi:integrase